MKESTLKRSISLPLLAAYGIGTIIGAGIYVLVGKVAGEAGMMAPFAFLVAAVLAGFTALSYAELSSRLPKSAGEVVYVQRALNKANLSRLVGFLIVLSGIVSASVLTIGFVGYFQVFFEVADWQIVAVLVLLMGGIAAWGIVESLVLVFIVTLIEVAGLIFVLVVAGDAFVTLPERLPEMIPSFSMGAWTGVLTGAFLAFYAFIGFEDMVNIAEEVKKPKKTLPIAILTALVLTTILYILIALVAVLSLPVDMLAESNAPLADILAQKGANYPIIISVISLIAVVNGALAQIIMASRLLYGMAKEDLAPRLLSSVNSYTRTPVIATVLVTVIILVLALFLPIISLAKFTSFAVLTVFVLINISLCVLKSRKPRIEEGFNCPKWWPHVATVLSLAFLIFQIVVFFD